MHFHKGEMKQRYQMEKERREKGRESKSESERERERERELEREREREGKKLSSHLEKLLKVLRLFPLQCTNPSPNTKNTK